MVKEAQPSRPSGGIFRLHRDILRSIVSRRGLAVAVIAVVGIIGFSSTRDGKGADPPARSRSEYDSQEVRTEALAATLNDLDAQGWEPVQIVPLWTIENENGVSKLSPKTYQVVSKRAKGAK